MVFLFSEAIGKLPSKTIGKVLSLTMGNVLSTTIGKVLAIYTHQAMKAIEVNAAMEQPSKWDYELCGGR